MWAKGTVFDLFLIPYIWRTRGYARVYWGVKMGELWVGGEPVFIIESSQSIYYMRNEKEYKVKGLKSTKNKLKTNIDTVG